MQAEEKLLTIVVPAYNVEKYIGQCLESLVRQSCTRFSVIIVNDGSTDKMTARICENYVQRFPQLFQYIYQENKGLGAARNTGMRMVHTPYIGFLDSDDWLCERYVERVVEEVEYYNDNCIDIIFTLPVCYDELLGQMYNWMDKPFYDSIFTPDSRIVEMAMDERPYWLEVNCCRRVYRTDFLRNNNFSFPEGTKWEDVYPHYFLLGNAKKCLGIPDVGFFYRTNVPTSITSSRGKDRLQIVDVFQKTFDYLNKTEASFGIMNSALKVYTVFSIWSIDVAKEEIRKELVERVHGLYMAQPEDKIRDFINTPGLLDDFQKRFVTNMLHNKRYKCYYDYQKQAIDFYKFKRFSK